MAVYFLDSSALVKRYIHETGSTWVLDLFDPALDNEIFVAAVTRVEIIAAIARRERGGNISAADAAIVYSQFRIDLQTDYQIIEILESIINSAMTFAQARGLRGYDAIQLGQQEPHTYPLREVREECERDEDFTRPQSNNRRSWEWTGG